MTNALAIAGVSAVLTELLTGWLLDQKPPSSIADVTVSALAPDLIKVDTGKLTQLNLFMYQATTSQGWRNVGPPSRDGAGRRTANQPLALDLHYLLTAYGSKNYHAEMLLGYAIQLLHETPVLTRDEIRQFQERSARDHDMPMANLAEQIEQIKISPQPLNSEELSKLWSAFQSRYRPSVAYQVSVVLIESTRPVRAALPVLTRGADDRGARVQGDPIPPFPTLTSVMMPNRQTSVRLGDVFTLNGFHLNGNHVEVHFASRRDVKPQPLVPLPESTAAQLQVQLPDDGLGWAAGLYMVTVTVGRDDQARQATNALPIVVAPRIHTMAIDGTNSRMMLRMTCNPVVLQDQRVSLLLGEREIPAEPRDRPTGELLFRLGDIQPGKYLVRLRVDGVDSIIVDATTTPPRFDPSQKIIIPPKDAQR